MAQPAMQKCLLRLVRSGFVATGRSPAIQELRQTCTAAIPAPNFPDISAVTTGSRIVPAGSWLSRATRTQPGQSARLSMRARSPHAARSAGEHTHRSLEAVLAQAGHHRTTQPSFPRPGARLSTDNPRRLRACVRDASHEARSAPIT